MNSVIAIGETVYDIIFRQRQPVAAKAGGSMLNTAVSLGRCGLNVEMMTELGDDHVGKLVVNFLAENGVGASFIKPGTGFKTPISLAFLDEQGNAEYSFYKNYPEDRLNINWPEMKSGDVLLFGSFYSLHRPIRQKVIDNVQKAKQNGGLILYDPNIRKNHLPEIRQMMHLVEENVRIADIVRGSDEDFGNLFGLQDPEEVFKRVRDIGCRYLIITKGRNGAELWSENYRLKVGSKNINVVSTIGAGDAFNAGIIYGMILNGITVHDLVNINEDLWKEILEFGITFASEVCQSFDNYISAGFARKLNERTSRRDF
jgi:fructokinase